MPSTPVESTARLHRPRIAVVTHGFLPLVGGAETHHALVADRLSTLATVSVFTSAMSLGSRFPLKLRGMVRLVPIETQSVETVYLPSLMLMREKYVLPWSLLRALRSFRPEVIWTNHPSASSFTAGLYAILTSTRWVATYHADLQRGSWLRRAFTRVESVILRRASLIEVSTARYSEVLVKRKVPLANVVVVSPFTWRSRFPPTGRRAAPSQWKGPDRSHPLLFVGALDSTHTYKRPELLIRAFSELKRTGSGACLIMVGGGDRLLELKELAKAVGCADSIEFSGTITDSELRDLYERAWLLVVPSTGDSEGYGLVIIEAVSHGCPVLASDDVPSIGYFRDAGGAATFRSNDSGDLLEVLRRLTSDAGARNALAFHASELDLSGQNEANLWRAVSLILPSAIRSTLTREASSVTSAD